MPTTTSSPRQIATGQPASHSCWIIADQAGLRLRRTLFGVCAWLCTPMTVGPTLVLAWSAAYGPCPLVLIMTGVPTTGSGLTGFSSAATCGRLVRTYMGIAVHQGQVS